MDKIVFATHNSHKLSEIRKILGSTYKILSLDEIGFFDEIEETGSTLQENALIKSQAIYSATGLNCFSDDTGLLVDVLHGEPGVYSARYAGIDSSYSENVDKLLNSLQGIKERTAYFSTVISLIYGGREYFFEGKVFGLITNQRRGDNGFGYDPVFQPDGYDETFAQMSSELKNKISHRAIAIGKLTDFLSKIK